MQLGIRMQDTMDLCIEKQYNKEFPYNPKVVAEVEHKKVTNRYAPYNEEHKRVLKRKPGNLAYEQSG